MHVTCRKYCQAGGRKTFKAKFYMKQTKRGHEKRDNTYVVPTSWKDNRANV